MNPATSKYTVLKQICKLIPVNLVSQLAKKYGVDKQARCFSPWSHVVSLVFAQLAHSLSLNDLCDSCRNHESLLLQIDSAVPPSRNGLSHANKIRNGDMAEELFWQVLSHIRKFHPKFGFKHGYSGLPQRFKRTIHAIDSTTIQLVVNSISWAKHRRRKAAAKCHMGLNLQTFLPEMAIVKAANTHDSTEAIELCSALKDGEIAVMDKAYVDFKHLSLLDNRGVFWVTRAKTNMDYKVVGQHKSPTKNILKDDIIQLTGNTTKTYYSNKLRLVEAVVVVQKKPRKMTFLTNNFFWAASSICDLYKSRWGVEVFFKQIKQTLQIADFMGYSENAVKWQIWTALLTYVLLRYIGEMGKWQGSFSRLFTLLRGVLFQKKEMYSIMNFCSRSRGSPRIIATPQQSYFPGF